MLLFGSATNLVFFALLCYLSVRSAAPELRRGQHGAGLPRGKVQSWRPRRGHGAGLPRGKVQSWRLRRGQHGAGLPRWEGPELAGTARSARSWTSKGGGPELAATARSARSWTSKGRGPELAATARSAGRGPDKPKNWRATNPRKWRGQTNPRTGGHTLHPMWWGSGG